MGVAIDTRSHILFNNKSNTNYNINIQNRFNNYESQIIKIYNKDLAYIFYKIHLFESEIKTNIIINICILLILIIELHYDIKFIHQALYIFYILTSCSLFFYLCNVILEDILTSFYNIISIIQKYKLNYLFMINVILIPIFSIPIYFILFSFVNNIIFFYMIMIYNFLFILNLSLFLYSHLDFLIYRKLFKKLNFNFLKCSIQLYYQVEVLKVLLN